MSFEDKKSTGAILRDGELESVNRVAVLLVQRPGYSLVELLDGSLRLLGYMAHDGVDHLTLVIPLLTFDDILGRHPSLGEIDITYPLLVDLVYPIVSLRCQTDLFPCRLGAPRQPHFDRHG